MLYCDYEILSTPAVTKVTHAGNVQSVHWGNLYQIFVKDWQNSLDF